MPAPEGEGMGDIEGERRYGSAWLGFARKPGGEAFHFQAGFTGRAAAIPASPVVDAACAHTAAPMRAAKAAGVPLVADVIAFPSPLSSLRTGRLRRCMTC